MKKLVITLKQHTPLIHFQSEQDGSTLRASEVKPKLDKFIITAIGNGNYDTGCKIVKENNWLVGKGEHYALDYKIKIVPINLQAPTEINPFLGYNQKGREILKESPMFFANMGNVEKKFYSMSDGCVLTIISKKDQVKSEISRHIATFFLSTNFGTRQTKGYGSFSMADSSPKTEQPYPELFFTVNGNEEQLFKSMELFHKAIRAGINDCWGQRFYFKSLMFAYAKSNNKQWEKKTIKQVYYPNILTDQTKIHSNSDILTNNNTSYNEFEHYYTYKDTLGLSSLEQWKVPYRKTIQKTSTHIDRFKSPILFKPIKVKENKYIVYILYTEIPDEFKNGEFSVTSSNDKGKLSLKIDPDFSIKKYFDFLFKQKPNGNYSIDINSMISVGRETPKAKKIQHIFNELRENYNKKQHYL